MTQYLILINGDEARWAAQSAEQRRKIDDGHRGFWERAGASVIASGELEPSTRAVTLRTGADGALVQTDGPFAEAKEVIGGFYVIEAPDRDHAVALAAGLAEARQGHGGVEIRPLVDHG